MKQSINLQKEANTLCTKLESCYNSQKSNKESKMKGNGLFGKEYKDK